MRNTRRHTPEQLSELLRYDPDTGGIYWKKDGPAAEPAGAMRLNARGDVNGRVIGILGNQYPYSHVAWALGRGQWPSSRVIFANTDPLDFRLANLALGSWAFDPANRKAARARRYYEKGKLRAQDRVRNDGLNYVSPYPGVFYSSVRPGQWLVHFNPPLPPNQTTAFPTAAQAEKYYIARRIGIDFVLANPEHTEMGDEDKFAGHSLGVYGPTLLAIEAWLAYDEDTGIFYWRQPQNQMGNRADLPSTRGGLNILFQDRRLPAHMLAWFMTYGTWPKRKSIVWLDGVKSNNRIANLKLREAP